MNLVVCAHCDNALCSVSDIINLSVEGNSTHFVNPGRLLEIKHIE